MSSTDLTFPVLLLLALPFLAFGAIAGMGSFLRASVGWVAAAFTAAGLGLSLLLFLSPESVQMQYDWIRLGPYVLTLSLRVDSLAGIMLLLVHAVALLVQVYSIAYMHDDPNRSRYFAFLQLFIFSMLGILLSGSLLLMYIFWELVGLSSYLLIGFWHHKPRAVWAAKKAFILNRIGDAAFLTGILLLLHHTGTTDFTALPSALSVLSPGLLTAIGLCLFGGCVGKSAQFPLSAWLPDAMEGPTPVSALIHAATMVAAGIFLLARISFLLTPTAQVVIACIGTITMLHGAWLALRAWDIKRVLAYSTISQLGLMVVAVGLGSWQTAMFHLLTHAFFKAGLFLSAGSVIHALHPTETQTNFDPQNMRTMGGLRTVMPRTFWCFVICAAALSGLPLLSGFLSKDAIFLAAFASTASLGSVAYVFAALAILAAGLTAYYMTRQVWLIFFGKKRYSAASVHPHESPALMWIPMAILAVGTLFFWYSSNPFEAESGWLFRVLQYAPDVHSVWVPMVSVAVTVSGIGFAWQKATGTRNFLADAGEDESPNWRLLAQQIFNRLRLLAEHSEETQQHIFFLGPLQKIARACAYIENRGIDTLVNRLSRYMVVVAHVLSWADRYLTDGGVRAVSYSVRGAGAVVRQFQNGKIQSYFLVTFVSVLLLLLWVLVI
ncbi:NADH-quinone oxidoreductase subunit L [Arundinibacter roseus]|uniref:NADH-quinone oxidoreductase subunit L n=1 Tax=Arundinibacter roseus TaxID=2070510 RepID=A0A4R4KRB0_9BACT|nr:NADH-quinone oxidoreductase subunit L [Arundinibacter roseus]TDB68951.1 NADH-quinone oxidoreductase subunit L [Arundinibacter roseus]